MMLHDDFAVGERVLVRHPLGDGKGWRWGIVVRCLANEKIGIRYQGMEYDTWHVPRRDVFHEMDGLAAILLEGSDHDD